MSRCLNPWTGIPRPFLCRRLPLLFSAWFVIIIINNEKNCWFCMILSLCKLYIYVWCMKTIVKMFKQQSDQWIIFLYLSCQNITIYMWRIHCVYSISFSFLFRVNGPLQGPLMLITLSFWTWLGRSYKFTVVCQSVRLFGVFLRIGS